jgi:hypothetical protein
VPSTPDGNEYRATQVVAEYGTKEAILPLEIRDVALACVRVS